MVTDAENELRERLRAVFQPVLKRYRLDQFPERTCGQDHLLIILAKVYRKVRINFKVLVAHFL